MAILIPDLKTLIDNIEKAYNANVGIDELPVSEQKARARQLGYVLNSAYAYLFYISKQIVPTTAEGEFLEAHCAAKKIFRKKEVAADGTVLAAGAVGAELKAGAVYLNPETNLLYEVKETVVFMGGEAEVCVVCREPGLKGNLKAGQRLVLQEAAAGVESSATVISVGAGADRESDADLLSRYLVYMHNLYYGGADSDYQKWALSVEGVNRVWVAGCEVGAGTVTIRIMTPAGLPDEALCQKVASYIETLRPVTAKRIFVMSPKVKTVDLTISGLTPNTAENRERVESAIAGVFAAVQDLGAVIRAAELNAVIYSALNGADYKLELNSNIVCAKNELAVLGEVIWN